MRSLPDTAGRARRCGPDPIPEEGSKGWPTIRASVKRLFFIGISSIILPGKFYVRIPLLSEDSPRLSPHSQNMTVAAMYMADLNICAHRS